jgi:hypothetical protein
MFLNIQENIDLGFLSIVKMKFSKGDLVHLSPLSNGKVKLSESPYSFIIVGYFRKKDIAVVIDFDRLSTMVLTSNCAGWVPSAFLNLVE